MTSMRLIAVRHGETEWNVAGREMGHLDSPLTERGRQQAEAVASRLAGLSLAALYSSDLGRAVATARCISRCCGQDVRVDVGLRERHMGVLQGLTSVEIAERHPALFEEQKEKGFYDRIPGGETAAQRRERSVRTFGAIAARHGSETIVAVTHAGLLGGFVEEVLGLPVGGLRHLRKHHASVNVFTFTQGVWQLETWNDISHLCP
jgi:2,3-bisphosphoglycerate-dependent phosphoglycerate mutase